MIYSNFFKEWIATCMRCGLALINFQSSIELYEIPKNFYDYDILKKYFILNADLLIVRSSCGHCINESCKAYMKNQ